MKSRLKFARALALVTALGAVGCWGGGPESRGTVPVTGLVTYRGQPLAHASVSFLGQQGAFGVTNEEGRFQLQSFAPEDGALPGEYRVTITKVKVFAPEIPEGEPGHVPPPPPKYLIPRKYNNPNTSELMATVAEGRENDFTFDLED